MLSNECPCGRARAGCLYHDPALNPPAAKSVPAPSLAPKDAWQSITEGNCVAVPVAATTSIGATLRAAEAVVKAYRAYQPVDHRWLLQTSEDPALGPCEWVIVDMPPGFNLGCIGMKVTA